MNHNGPVDLRGKRFGTWTVLNAYPLSKGPQGNKKVYWKVVCDCGANSEVGAYPLLSGKSLGCYSCGRKKLEVDAFNLLCKQIEYNAIQRGFEFSVAPVFLKRLLVKQNYVCALSGLPIEIATSGAKHRRGETTASLDRVDSSLGYTANNVQWLHKDINLMKLDLPQSRFVELCRKVAGYVDPCDQPYDYFVRKDVFETGEWEQPVEKPKKKVLVRKKK